MGLHVPDFVRVQINGVDRTEYVVSYHRRDDLCELGSTFTLKLNSDFPVALNPYDSVYIQEKYDADVGGVLRGYIVKITRDYEDGGWDIEGMDKSIRLIDYFIPNQLEAHAETVDYWITYLCGLAGLAVHFDVTSTYIVEDGTFLGLQKVSEAILQLERQAAYYTKYDSSIDSVVVFRLGSSSPQVSLTDDITLGAQRNTGTENTRNVVKVYGGYKYDIITGLATQIFAKASSGIPELLVDKTSVIVSPVLRSQTYAFIVANRILSVVNGLDDEHLIQVAGFYPTVVVGKGVYIDLNITGYDFAGNRTLTSIETSIDEKGAITTFGVGKKCPRISVALADPPIFVTDTVNGVGVSWNGGESFIPSNLGLVEPGAKNASSIAVNQWSQSMVLTQDGLYRRYGTVGTWAKLPDLPDPINSAEDVPAPTISGISLVKVVDEPTGAGKFHILGRNVIGLDRTWVYTTRDFGNTWNSEEIQVDSLVASGGKTYNAYGADLEVSPINNVYVLVNSIETLYPKSIYILDRRLSWTMDIYSWDGIIPQVLLTTLVYAKVHNTQRIWSHPLDRNIVYVANVTYPDSDPAGVVTTYVDRSIDGGLNWSRVHEEEFMAGETSKIEDGFGVWFDDSSSSSSVRIAISGWSATTTSTTCHVRFITSDPAGSTVYEDKTETHSYGTTYSSNGRLFFNKDARTTNFGSSNFAYTACMAYKNIQTGSPPHTVQISMFPNVTKIGITDKTIVIYTQEILLATNATWFNNWVDILNLCDDGTVNIVIATALFGQLKRYLYSASAGTLSLVHTFTPFVDGPGFLLENITLPDYSGAFDRSYYYSSYPNTVHRIINNDGSTSDPTYNPLAGVIKTGYNYGPNYYTIGTYDGMAGPPTSTLLTSADLVTWTKYWNINGGGDDFDFKEAL